MRRKRWKDQTRGVGNNMGHGQQQQQLNQNWMQHQQPYYSTQQQMHQNPPSNKKHFANWNFCWTHGCNILEWHNSQRCPNPEPRHVCQVTRENMCGGSTRAVHKTVWPNTWRGGANNRLTNTVNELPVNIIYSTPKLNDFYCGSCFSVSETTNYYAIIDSVATDNFILQTADIESKNAAHKPMRITLPDSSTNI